MRTMMITDPKHQKSTGHSDRRVFLRHLLCLSRCASALPVALTFSPAAHAAEMAGSVTYLKGHAAAQLSGGARELAERAPVYISEMIKTEPNTRLGLRLGNRTTLRIGGSTMIKLTKYLMDAGGEIDLEAGALQFERTGPPAKTELNLRSPYGLIVVRGTRFFAGPSKGVFGVLVGSGRVTVTAAGVTVTLGPQQGTDIAHIGAAPSPPRPWGGTRIAEALQSIR